MDVDLVFHIGIAVLQRPVKSGRIIVTVADSTAKASSPDRLTHCAISFAFSR